MKIRIFGRIVAAAAAASLLLTGCGAANSGGGDAKELKSVKVGYIADYNGASLLAVADQEGYWKKAGLKPEYVPFTNGPLAIQALGTGNIDVGYIGSGALWLPAQGKAEIWAINSISNADRVIAQPGINSLADLKGKKLGVPAGTSGELLLNLALKKSGMTKSDFQIVPMDPSTAVSAFASKQIDGAALWYPLIDTLKKRSPDLKELASNKDFIDDVTFPSSFVAQKGRASKEPELAKSFDSVMKQANDYRFKNPDKTIAVTATFLKLDAAILKAQSDVATLFTSADLESRTKDGTVNKWLKGLEEQFVTTKQLTSVVDPKTFYIAQTYLDAPKG